MTDRLLPAAALALAVLLTGCSGFAIPGGGETPTATPTATSSPTATSTATTTPTATPTWEKPQPPNTPTEVKDEEGRISRVEFVNKEENGDGYSSFDLTVYANTAMENVDPPDHGSVEGEPYFLVYVNDKLVTRTKIVVQETDGEFDVGVKEAALEEFEAGTLDVKVVLMDEDSQHDDRYGTWSGTIKYAPD